MLSYTGVSAHNWIFDSPENKYPRRSSDSRRATAGEDGLGHNVLTLVYLYGASSSCSWRTRRQGVTIRIVQVVDEMV